MFQPSKGTLYEQICEALKQLNILIRLFISNALTRVQLDIIASKVDRLIQRQLGQVLQDAADIKKRTTVEENSRDKENDMAPHSRSTVNVSTQLQKFQRQSPTSVACFLSNLGVTANSSSSLPCGLPVSCTRGHCRLIDCIVSSVLTFRLTQRDIILQGHLVP
jgi:hypothetical protein